MDPPVVDVLVIYFYPTRLWGAWVSSWWRIAPEIAVKSKAKKHHPNTDTKHLRHMS
jgi:hypothetical protein